MPQKKKRVRVRYDRIFIVAVFLFLLIFGIVQMVSCNSKKDTADTTEAEPEEFVPVIYLSPSNQDDNVYATGNETEASAMREISNVVRKHLEEHGMIVHLASSNDSIQQKVDFSNSNEITAHVAIHSNAGGESGGGEGTECFYNPKVYGSKILAEYIYNRVSRLTPTNDRGMFDGTEGSSYLFEVAMTKTPNCLIEIEFHDSSKQAKWIIENTDAVGKSIADGIIQYVNYIGDAPNQLSTESSEQNDTEQD